MAAGTHNITLEKGVDYAATFNHKDSDNEAINITGYTFKSQVRRKASTGVAATFTSAITNATGGQVKLSMAGSVTRTLPVGKLQYDLVSQDGAGAIKRYITGTITVKDTVTDTSSF